ncbi:MAG: heme o synthase [Bryobacterales bacterium]|nr:heme o synthase [Bryobacteraceae bacterium]MDW8130450.1 heme o synthase [Bryobacterales bacterium]
MKAYWELTKPRITWLILMSTAVGYFAGRPAQWDAWQLLHALLGTALMASGTAALNQWYERDTDARMRRTRHRPIPAGSVTPGRALVFGLAVSLAGFLELWLGARPLAALCGLATLLLYLLAYTPLKTRTPHAMAAGAIPGAMPPLIGYAAASGSLDAPAWALFLILLLWQFPHFLAIGWMYREDYARGGIRMLPVLDSDGSRTGRQALLFSALLIPAAMLPALLGAAGWFYVAGALALGIAMLRAASALARARSVAAARGLLRATILYLPALYLLMMAG